MITAQDGSIHLLRNNEHTWTREESLAHVIPAYTVFLDLPLPEPELHLSASSKNVLSAYIDRVTTHIKQLRDLPSGLATFARHFATGRYEEIELESTKRDAFGLRKFIIVPTGTGKLVALDSANRGNVVWSRLFDTGSEIHGMWVLRESSAVQGQPPLIGVIVVRHGIYSFIQINGLNGEIVGEEEFDVGDSGVIVKAFLAPLTLLDENGLRIVICISDKGDVKGLPSTVETTSLLKDISGNLYYSVPESNALQGFVFDTVYLSLFNSNSSPSKVCRRGGSKFPWIINLFRYRREPQVRKLRR
jgi:ER membrane protein complex subunit 1